MRIAIAVAAALGLASLVVADPSHGAIKRHTHIPAQSLGPALKDFAESRDLQILYFTNIVRDLRTRGAVGEITTNEALNQILLGTGLTYKYLDDRTITILPEAEEAGSQSPPPLQEPTADDKVEQTQRASFWDRLRIAQAGSPPTQTTSAGASTDNDSHFKKLEVEEVIVTAQKRNERLMEVPISMSVLSGEALDSSTAEDLTEILNRVPGVSTLTNMQTGGTMIRVRGVGSNGSLFSGTNPVSYYLDSMPFGLVKTPIAPDSSAYDLERVEILRGPQGTLYGANAQNGVVRVLTKDANLDEFQLKARTSASGTEGGGDNYRGDMAFNAPVVPGRVGVRAVVGYQNLSGWIDRTNKDDANDAEIKTLRLKLDAQPVDALSVGLMGWFSRSDYGAPSFSDDRQQHSSVADESSSSDYEILGLTLEYDFPGFSVSSTSSYLDYSTAGSQDLYPQIFFPVQIFTDLEAKVFSQEVLLNSDSDGSWRWALGGSYRDGDDRLHQLVPLVGAELDWTNTSRAYAAFGEVSRRFLNDRFQWTLGLRYFHDDVGIDEHFVPPGQVAIHSDSTFDSTTPRAVLTWFPSNNLTLYGSYSEGFRSGFDQNPIVTRQVPSFSAVRPDELRNYEIGAKAELWGGRLSIDSAVYYIDWRDAPQSLQVSVGTLNVTAIVNSEASSGAGLDFSIVAKPIDGLQLGANFGWNDLTMDGRVESGSQLLFDKGDRLLFSPEYTAGVFADYAFAMRVGGLQGRLSASANYVSQQESRFLIGTEYEILQSDTILVARASFSVERGEHWSATLFADNLNNERGASSVISTVPDWSSRERPRTVGLQIEYRY